MVCSDPSELGSLWGLISPPPQMWPSPAYAAIRWTNTTAIHCHKEQNEQENYDKKGEARLVTNIF